MYCDLTKQSLIGSHGALDIADNDEVTHKLVMLIEGECEGLGPTKAARKYGISKGRYFQLRKSYHEQGALALLSKQRGPKTRYRRTGKLIRQVIRYRFLDPKMSAEVIAQKLRQTGFVISTRSVERVIEDYGLQKKTLPITSSE
jgi:transposase